MHFSVTLSFSFCLALAASVVADLDPQISPLGLRTKHGKTSKRAISSLLDKREVCEGTCQICFGPNYTKCPDSIFYCYDPTQGSASSQCSLFGDAGSSGSSSSSPTRTSSGSPAATETESCYKKGANCQSCFGAGSVSCPSGSHFDCYEPAQMSEAEGCNEPGSGGSAPPAPSSTGSSNSCETQYGAGSVLCGQDGCYNPGDGEMCCGDGYHCPAGTQCVPSGSTYKCPEGGSGGSLGSSLTGTSTRSPSAASSGILNTAISSIGPIGGGSGSGSTTRSTPSRLSTSTDAFAAQSTSSNSASLDTPPALLGKYTGPGAALAAALLALAVLL